LTEIPEHLLKRSKERRAALGLPGGESGGDDAGAGDSGAAASDAPAAAPAKAEAPAPAKVEEKPPPPPKPKPEYIQAAEKRKRIPYWAMPVLVLLPVWAYIYADGVTPPPQSDEQLIVGEEVYASCQGCHGPTGGGGTGAQLSEGEVVKTWPDPMGMMEWIHLGGNEWTGTPGPADYGDPNREGGPHNTGTLSSPMPAFGDLTPEELAGVTRYIRENLSGEPVASPELQEEYELWAEAAIENAEAGELIYRDGVEPDQERIDRAASGE
jgi:mono/diheme cytochrome c family protein